ncbi:unnamed protein product [Penicillium pancosmium]
MIPSILIIGATGNTGRAVAQTLPTLLQSSSSLSGHRVIALTHSSSIIEQNWAEITVDWLREHQVARAFIASRIEPSQFAEESTFYLNALNGGVNTGLSRRLTRVRQLAVDLPQPNVFSPLIMSPAVDFVKRFRETGKQDTLRLLLSKDAPVGIIDPDEIGVIAARLLSLDDTSAHNKAKYVLNEPEDITGMQIVAMVEQHIGTPVNDVSYKDVSFIDMVYEYKYTATKESKNVIYSIKRAPETAWEGKCSASTASPEILKLAAPKRTPADTLKALLEG